jgi:hypothetical protein
MSMTVFNEADIRETKEIVKKYIHDANNDGRIIVETEGVFHLGKETQHRFDPGDIEVTMVWSV